MKEVWLIFYDKNGERQVFPTVSESKEQAINGTMLIEALHPGEYKNKEIVKYVKAKPCQK